MTNQNISAQDKDKVKRSNRITIIALIVLFTAPILLALWSFNHADDIGFHTKNIGDLVRPARPLQPVELLNINDNKSFKLIDLQKSWVMLYFVSGKCGDVCFNELYKIRQSRLAQGGELKRIKRVIVLLDKQDPEVLKKINREHVGSIVVSGSAESLDKLSSQFEIEGEKSVRDSKRIYLLDPIGNFILKYEQKNTAGEIVKDLKRLLHVSQIG